VGFEVHRLGPSGRRGGRAAAALSLLLTLGCGAGVQQYPLHEPLWVDPDRHPFAPAPEEYYSPFAWDAVDQTIFYPISRFFAVRPAGAAKNVNALDEVPDSSWFENRIGREAVSPPRLARGPCSTPPLDPTQPWLVKSAKPDGANPGFVVEGPDGRRYIIKFDGRMQGPRATTADVIGSRLYWAAGYHTPCNRVVYVDRSRLSVAPDATYEDYRGRTWPLTSAEIDRTFDKTLQLADGRFRANSSLVLEGTPLGPWKYQGTRGDDPNDVIPHQDRRELRGMRLLAAWINHFDSREQNTLASFVAARDGRGYVRHHVIDFGDSLGSLWSPPALGRRIGHSYYLDIPYVLEDWLTLGFIERPWDTARLGRSGRVFGYFSVERFEPERWRPGYPNPAFGRMQERDGAWMARIIARFSPEHLQALVATADLQDSFLEHELLRILTGRRERILRRYLLGLSPLTDPQLQRHAERVWLCLTDLVVSSGLLPAQARSYSARIFAGPSATAIGATRVHAHPPSACVELPAELPDDAGQPAYVIVDVWADTYGAGPQPPSRLHLYRLGPFDYRLVALERPDTHEPPG